MGNFGRRKFMGLMAFLGASTKAFASETKANHNALKTSAQVDICVLGGSCTGVFAAVRAARLGAKVMIIEKQNAFGGVATSSLVNVWHSLMDANYKKQIIAGITQEIMQRLEKRNACVRHEKNASAGFSFNSQELKIELDALVIESNVKPLLHTIFSEPYFEDGKLVGVIIDNKSGRSIVRAKYFIDATGDGDLCHRMGVPSYFSEHPQPPTTCAHLDAYDTRKAGSILKEHSREYNLPLGFRWSKGIPNSDTVMLAATRVTGANMCDADSLTMAEIEGRRQVGSIADMYNKYSDTPVAITALPSYIGVRESRHISCLHKVSDIEAMNCVRYPDAVVNGSYRFDVHHQEKGGLTFYYLDGREVYACPGKPSENKKWKDYGKETPPSFYQIPFRAQIPQGTQNVVLAGRMLDAEPIAFGGLRVMVNMNQLGESAGVASYLALQKNCDIKDVDPQELRSTLAKGGSIII